MQYFGGYMSALPESGFEHEATIEPLFTDHYLEHEYGHLSPDELAVAGIHARYRARLAQLQIAALHEVTHAPEESLVWIKSYQTYSNQLSLDDTYI